MEVLIKPVFSSSEVPLDLLLLADPSKEQVEKYIDDGDCLIALVGSEIVGEIVIVSKEENIMEIINVAVKEDFQGRGIGKKLIVCAIDLAKNRMAKRIEIGLEIQV